MNKTKQDGFYEAFGEHYSELYWLAFLLTGDRELSVQAFTNALDGDVGANPFYRDWIVSWARRLVIAGALGVITSELRESVRRVEKSRVEVPAIDRRQSGIRAGFEGITKAEFEQAVLAVDVFPRCALLLTVFEKLSIYDTARLLGTDETLGRKAQGLGLVELTRNIARIRGSKEQTDEIMPPAL